METPLRVLIVEDDESFARLTQLHLEEPDLSFPAIETKTASTVARALELSQQEPFDAVVLDLNLPDASRLESVERLRAERPRLPLVVLTGMADEQTGRAALGRGAQDYLPKDGADPRTLKRSVVFAIARLKLLSQLTRLESLRGELKERRKSEEWKGRLLGNLAHDLRCPLSVAKAAVANIWEGLPGIPEPESRQMLILADRNLDRVMRMVDNYLAMSRLEANVAQPQRRPLALDRLLKEAVESQRVGAQRQRKVTLGLCVQGGLPKVLADADMLLEVINNLIDNARRYAATRVTVEARVCGDGAVEASVSDDGPGLSVDALADVFQRFYQSQERPPSEHHPGAGLGLAICRDFVELNGGRIWAENRPEGGARFAFRLSQAIAAGV